MKCLICNEEFDSKRKLGGHFLSHGLTANEYKEKFKLYSNCKVCGIRLCETNKSGTCVKHLDRHGAKNPFYGKTHSKETREILKEKCKHATTKMWKDREYRNKVISNATGVKRSNKFKETQRKNALKWYKNNPNERISRSKRMKRSWKDGSITINTHSINRSKAEEEIRNIFESKLGDCVKQKTVHIGNKWYYPDIIIDDYFIIEYYGNFWHGNPNIYDADDMIHHGKTAADIWKHDTNRQQTLEKNGYYCFIIWEDMYSNNPEECIKQVLSVYENWKHNK